MKNILERIVLDSIDTIKEKALGETAQKNKNNHNNDDEISSFEKNDGFLPKNIPEDTAKKKCSQNFENSKTNAHISMINAFNRNKRLNIMVIGAALGLVFCLLMLTSYSGDLPGEVVGIVSTISGIFGACLKDAYSFEFGSSRGSKDKDEKISSTILEKIKIS
ncbi:MAG: hypothetical protein LBB12_03410 [Holosporaceae bacterium]|jgi:hypothetical protein|nr:hypothetical protein [Holosporaceae bacterium]